MKHLLKNLCLTMALLICFTLVTYAQIRVQKQGRVSMGNATPSSTDQLWIKPGGKDCGIVIDHQPTLPWFQSMSTYSHNKQSAHYVVKDKTAVGNQDVFYVIGTGMIYSQGLYLGSDSTLKYDIKSLENPLDKILQLRGVSYLLKSGSGDSNNQRHNGLIAQEVESIIPEAVNTMHNGIKAISYSDLTAMLIESVKAQNESIKDNLRQLEEAKEEIKKLNELLSSCCNSENKFSTTKPTARKATLFQNMPNPFNEKTEIRYFIPDKFNSAFIKVYSINGHEIKSLPLESAGEGNIHIAASSLSPGTYVYHLIVDGEQIDSKLMTIISQ